MRLDLPAPAANAPLRHQLLWVRQQALAFANEHSAVRFEPSELADEIALAVNLTRFEPRHSESTLEIPFSGWTRYRIEGKDWFNCAGMQALYLPGQAFDVETSHFNGLLLNLKPSRLAATIGLVSRGTVPVELAERWVQQPLAIDLRDPRINGLQHGLEAACAQLAQVNGPTLGAPFGAAALAVEQLAYTSSACMVLVAMESERRGAC
jgi:hypothetical protein